MLTSRAIIENLFQGSRRLLRHSFVSLKRPRLLYGQTNATNLSLGLNICFVLRRSYVILSSIVNLYSKQTLLISESARSYHRSTTMGSKKWLHTRQKPFPHDRKSFRQLKKRLTPSFSEPNSFAFTCSGVILELLRTTARYDGFIAWNLKAAWSDG